eukprot:gnl/TRDRNA2_/TRDRNA2_201763_c0_seq1.p1 gnl/TRDRNA2_/TRDRNA2_201763_c0~~gnl/TRDRNA2_/TRDRNA2_201763_c0_seq1.p1  ORF type:complete len:366 (-),score=24.10 gnl/TRDRNA2_/TRDRNA2_201763_c0_seq1:31-1068(-)
MACVEDRCQQVLLHDVECQHASSRCCLKVGVAFAGASCLALLSGITVGVSGPASVLPFGTSEALLFERSIPMSMYMREPRISLDGHGWRQPQSLKLYFASEIRKLTYGGLSSFTVLPSAVPMLQSYGRFQRCSACSTDRTKLDRPAVSEIPSLRFLGDAQLMQVQPKVPRKEISTDAFQQMVETLSKAMDHYGGIGIAAPQIGLWTRIFVFGINSTNSRYPAAAAIPFQVWINPEISWVSPETNWMWEGCLSVPGLRGWVERPRAVRLHGLDENGVEREVELDGLEARIAQHELDHLEGVLFPHRVPGASFIVPQASMDMREGWAEGWPSPGSRQTGPGQLSNEK